MTFSVNNSVVHESTDCISTGILDMLQLQMDIETAYEQLDDNFKHLAEVEDAMTNIRTATDILKNCTDAETTMKILDIDGGLESIGIAIESATKVTALEGLLDAAATGAKKFVAYIARIISVMLGLISTMLQGIGHLLSKIPGIGMFLGSIFYYPGKALEDAVYSKTMDELRTWGFTMVQVRPFTHAGEDVNDESPRGLVTLLTLHQYDDALKTIFDVAFRCIDYELELLQKGASTTLPRVSSDSYVYQTTDIGNHVERRLIEYHPHFVWTKSLDESRYDTDKLTLEQMGWRRNYIKKFVDSDFKQKMGSYTSVLNKAKLILNKIFAEVDSKEGVRGAGYQTHVHYACNLMREVTSVANHGLKTYQAQLAALVQLGKVAKSKADELGKFAVPGGSPEAGEKIKAKLD